MRLHRAVGIAAVAVPLAAASVAGAAPVPGTDVTYTSDADFDQGALVDVNHDAPNSDQLQLDRTSTPFPFITVAASQRGTAVRIDVNTGQILGEYQTAPDGRGRNPSRTTVDKFGNVWVANRDESSISDGVPKGSVARIGLVTGGTRTDAGGNPDLAGDYLKGPFAYNTCTDRDGDGLLKTSAGLGDIRPWTNPGGVDDHGGVSSAEDECLITYTRVTGTNTRTVAVDANNDVWVGGANTAHEKLDGSTGQPVAGTQFNLGCGGYGGLIDKNGTLWSARFGAGLLRYDPATATGVCLGNTIRGDYGLGLDPLTGNVWHTFLFGNRVAKLDALAAPPFPPAEPLIGTFAHGDDTAQGVAVDDDGNVWVAHSLFGRTTVGHLLTDGTYIGNVTLPGGNGPTGVSIDSNGKVWVTNLNTDNVSRIDPNTGSIHLPTGRHVGAVDLTVSLGANAGPYNYSDMTGSVLGTITAPQGTWTVIQDSGAAGMPWGTIAWNAEPQGSEPGGTAITVEARAADSLAALAGESFQAVTNGSAFSLAGRYIEVRSTLNAAGDGTSPVLSDLRILAANRPPDCSAAAPSTGEIWAPNHKFVDVGVLGVTDPDGDAVGILITGIRQDEPTDTTGDGRFAPDGQGVGTDTAQVRAERSGSPKVPGDGRFYHIAFSATDAFGGACSGTVTTVVPHDQAKAPVDGGPLHDSTS